MTACATGCEAINTGNDVLILNEIKHALSKLLETDEPTTIDLRSIPMAPGEEASIEAMLGEGEISVQMNALGPSTMQETAIAGVWLVTHFNVEEEILSKFIEITRIPSLLESPTEDIKSGLLELQKKLLEQ